jgi:tetratricopeptide (TPR) repeat protein
MSRDDFPLPIVRRLAQRAGHRCSNPDCGRDTSGPSSVLDEGVNIGVAAHITAASAGGPRFDATLSSKERSAIGNGIWLCQSCGKLIDSDEVRFKKEVIGTWKASAELLAKLRLETPARPQDSGPILVLPASDASVSWLPFSARATTLVGREVERAQLNAFLQSNQKVAWLLVAGAGGTGKSRLALELCHAIRPEWDAGFLSRTDRFRRWSHFRPSRPTLLVIDYVAGRATDASALVLDLARSASYLPSPVRILLLEREQGAWWRRFLREDSHTESDEMLSCQHAEPIVLGGLPHEALQALGAEVARRQGLSWNNSAVHAFASRMRTLDPLGRPLFGMMIAAYSTENGDALNQDLLSVVLKKERARQRMLIPDGETYLKMENLAILATLVGGLRPRANGFEFLTAAGITTLTPNVDLVDRHVYRDFVSATSADSTLAGFQPDILGERLVLDRVRAADGVDGITTRLLLAAWSLEPDDLCDFILRVASDFSSDPAINVLCDLPCPSNDARARWGWLVGDMIRVANRSDDRRTQDLLAKLHDLTRTFPTEPNLQNALARAEFHLANIFLFTEEDYEHAAHWFDTAIGHAMPGSDVEASIRNNRGILYHILQNEDQAFRDWSDVIANESVPDEARACSLNNRADIFARRGLHQDAIRDRSSVLALQQTSPDRRYIALIRRSSSYIALDQIDDALRDLEDILCVADIAPEQKAEARLRRGMMFIELDRDKEAEVDLQAVCSTDGLFSGTLASSLVALGELARRRGDIAATREYLEVATSSEDADDETVVESLVVWARALADQGAVADAERVWQAILANAHATERQRSLAEESRPHRA